MTCDQCGQPLFLCQCQESGVTVPAVAGSQATGNRTLVGVTPADRYTVDGLVAILGISRGSAFDIVSAMYLELYEAQAMADRWVF